MSAKAARANRRVKAVKAKQRLRDWYNRGKKKIGDRLEGVRRDPTPRDSGPEFGAKKIHYEVSERTQAIACGGLGAIHQLVQNVGLVKAIDEGLPILKRHRPYRESDHVLNIAYNILSGGKVLDDIEVRRNDAAFLDAINARAIPDPTTVGDFCRRFDHDTINTFMNIVNETRLNVWQQQPRSFFEETARIDVDSTIVTTQGECKQGMDLAYNGEWGYHPIVVTLANTKEPLFIVNRSGNRPSGEGSLEYIKRSIKLCRRAGFKDILVRGDTRIASGKDLDELDDEGVRFVFGYDARKNMIEEANGIYEDEYQALVRKAEIVLNARKKQPRVKDEIIRHREYLNLKLEEEDIAEFDYQSGASNRAYRIIVLAKTIVEEKGQRTLGYRTRYFFYVTNDWNITIEQVIKESNDRCNQENIIGEQKSGTRAFTAPLNTLNANWAYMVMASLAWSLKAWLALLLPVEPGKETQHNADRERVLRMEFRSFLQRIILFPAQIITTGRRLVYRILAWRPDLPILFRFLDAL
jgi:Transposase DDE domain group 1